LPEKLEGLRILIVNKALGSFIGGGESFDKAAAIHLQRKGHRVTVLTNRPLTDRNALVEAELDTVYVKSPDLKRFAYRIEKKHVYVAALLNHIDAFLFQRKVFKWIAKHPDFDVIQTCSLFRLARWILNKSNIAVVVWLPGKPSRLTRRIMGKMKGKQRFCLFTHGDTADFLVEKMNYTESLDFTVVEPGVELDKIEKVKSNKGHLREKLRIPEDAVLGITVCRLLPIKNLSMLISSLAEISLKDKNIFWLIVGEGPEEEILKDLVRNKRIQDRIHFAGQVSNTEVHELLDASDIFALTSLYESYGISTLEAMGHGLPVICTKAGYLVELIRKSEGGVLVEIDDTRRLAEEITKLSDSAELRNNYGQNGKAYVLQFGWMRTVEKLIAVYQKAIFAK